MTDGSVPPLVRRLVALDDAIQPPQLLLTDDPCTIGRADGNRVVVPRQTVSRLHAVIGREGDRFVLRDLGSRNGTFVNGLLLDGPRTLADRDAIGLGAPDALLRFVDDVTVPASATTAGTAPPRLTYDDRLLRFAFDSRPLDLTPNEFRLLLHLYRRLGAVCSRESCAAAIWGDDYPPGRDADALDKVVSTLRGKLRRLDPAADLVQTRPGYGYTLVA
ncbi:MAG TPA: FHA domain-containing protein [Thermomicrobiales bacterium]|jgi:DNA-binding response OmpR family regulator